MLLLISIVLGLLGLACFLAVFSFYRAPYPISRGERLAVTVIPAPTPTHTEEVSPTEIPEPSSSATPLTTASGIHLNSYVQVSGTQGDGLRLREEAGIGNTILSVASESEVFIVLDGPKQADGYQWWFIADPYNEKRRGWAAENYLMIIQ